RGVERRRAALVFKRARAGRARGSDRQKRDEVMSRRAVRCEKKGEGPECTIERSLAGTASIARDVEGIEGQLDDIGGA
ncbi:DUF2948 family protein, partial [Rhizobium ruizarguesonis]